VAVRESGANSLLNIPVFALQSSEDY